MNSKKSPHEASLEIISRIESDSFPVFDDLSISHLSYVERCLDQKIHALAIRDDLVNGQELRREIDDFKDNQKIITMTIKDCQLQQEKLNEYQEQISSAQQKLANLKTQRKKLDILRSFKKVLSKIFKLDSRWF